ncbi:uncharacterized protein BDZ99DRAFT_455260 [Mytilinidion resinicola]|uniref:Rhamnogalacturonase A/B/Epimerase-like pectate lyase domain-containing protein n=1 Tax=Mytilinidion resinicola TaxID=574789 RepID=A0A6A6Y2V4_9PEZI|nr:uncharacterized protein BDZ99DRAFT_455260 [Mytilinidion resinicola]KAF2802117.1 hypothetical protein BDZ99DRAFT_455260 [Mytilinidion resinicola]
MRSLSLIILPSLLYLLSTLTSVAAVTVDYKNYKTSKGDKLPNFSYAGYHASEKSLPASNSKVTKTLSPGSGDQTAAIQAALDSVWKAGGGVVALKAGKYAITPGLVIRNYTTLRGAGVGKTILNVKSLSGDVITIGDQTGKGKAIKTALITDSYIAAGTGTVHVVDASGFAVGQEVMVQRQVTKSWIAELGMNALVRSGKIQTWIKPGTLVQQPRKIASIHGKAISVDVPFTDSLIPAWSPQLVAYTPPSQPSEIGLESLSLTLSPSCSGRILSDTTCTANALLIGTWSTDSWIRDLALTGFNNFITVAYNASRITLSNIAMHRDGATDNGAGYALDVSLDGSQVLVENCSTQGAADSRSYSVATKALTPGPNAVLNYVHEQAVESIEPHMRWAHGLLVENQEGGALSLRNRATAGTGHGWTVNNAVGWNVNAKKLDIESPAGGQNYCFGCIGTPVSGNNGTYVSTCTHVEPKSLFAAQLADRGFDASKLGI